MRIAVLQHVPFEGSAALGEWAAEQQIPIHVHHLYEGEPLPELTAFDMLTVLGGPMSVKDTQRFSWLQSEIDLVRDAINANKIVLGICLGAQLIAKALGAKVYAAACKEIGWFPVRNIGEAHPLFGGLPPVFVAFHWHGETFDLPEGAARLAETSAVPNQAFAYGSRVLGLQFHIETTQESVQALVKNAADEIGTGPFEQSPDTILAGVSHYQSLRPLLKQVLLNLTGPLGEGT
ncbi:MAG: type 1 glutamine amidotransferase [Rhodomicrobium sp.]